MEKSRGNSLKAMGRKARTDGDATRLQILEVAGNIFAEFGYAASSSKQICKEAKVNMAAVNYHFGNKEGLYSTVLIEAHRRLISLEDLTAIADSNGDARSKLGHVIDRMIDAVGTEGWHLRVYLREMLSPSAAIDVMLNRQLLPKIDILKNLLSQFTGIPPEDPVLARCELTTFVPAIFIVIANKKILSKVMPGLLEDKDALKQHIKTFVFAGCEAVTHK